MKIKIGTFEKEVTPEEIKHEDFEIDFDGALMVAINQSGGEYRVINAMNGYGDNCKKEYANIKVEIIK